MKNGKIFAKINIIDLLVVIVLIAVVVGIAVRLMVASNSGLTGSTDFEYVVRIEGIRDYTVRGLQRAGAVFSEENDVYVGDITSVTHENEKADVITLDGQRKFIERPDRYTAYVTVRATGTCVNGQYYDSDKTEISVGKEHKISSKYVGTNGKIISVIPAE